MQSKFYIIKKNLFFLLSFLIVSTTFGQLKLIKNYARVSMPVYEHQFSELLQLKLPTAYSEASFEQALKTVNIFDIEILAWDLVFTRNPIGVNHDQLNENRLKWFYNRLPVAFKIPKHQIRIVEQTNGNTRALAVELFHGFAIYYRLKHKPELLDAELKLVESIMATKPVKETKSGGGDKVPLKITKPSTTGKLTKRQSTMFKVDEVEFTYTCNSDDMRRMFKENFDSIEVVSLNQLMDRSMLYNRNAYEHCDSVVIGYKFYKKNKILNLDSISSILDDTTFTRTLKKPMKFPLADSTVLNVMNRNNWTKYVVCIDVTGSMSPFTAQLIYWLKTQPTISDQNLYYFFNDGNSKRDSEKVIGKTGGIFKIKTGNIKDIVKTLQLAMRSGYGGDAPENNIECVIQAQRENPEANEILMLADNWVPVKDMELLPEVKVPVRVILCGNRRSLHPDYLTVAFKTKGSVHWGDKDLNELYKMKDGETLDYNNTIYKLTNGVFVVMPRKG